MADLAVALSVSWQVGAAAAAASLSLADGGAASFTFDHFWTQDDLWLYTFIVTCPCSCNLRKNFDIALTNVIHAGLCEPWKFSSRCCGADAATTTVPLQGLADAVGQLGVEGQAAVVAAAGALFSQHQ